jgi:hypothetical protein
MDLFSQLRLHHPLVTAIIFVAASLTLDFFFVAPLIEKSFDMFRSVIGVWIPQALIFAATYLTGLLTGSGSKSPLHRST